jgi:chromosome segregation ATPase
MTIETEEKPDPPDGGEGPGKASGSTPDGGDDDHKNRAERRAAEFAAKLKDAEGRLAAIDAEKKKLAEEQQRSKGQWDELLKGRDAELAAERDEKSKLTAEVASLKNRLTENEILEQLAAMDGVKAPQSKLRHAYVGLFGDSPDRFPDEKSKAAAIKERDKKMREAWPELYGSTTTTGGSPSPTGATKPAKGGGEGFY